MLTDMEETTKPTEVPDDEAWFWTAQWQEGEREVDAQLAAGQTTTYDSVEDFIESLSQSQTP
jgi:hypothetical protein